MSEYADPFDVTTPALDALAGEGDDRIRELKRALKERLNNDHYWDGEATVEAATADGKHRKVSLSNSAGTPTSVADSIILYCKDSNSKAELFARHEDGYDIQLTNNVAAIWEAAVAVGQTRTCTIYNGKAGDVYEIAYVNFDLASFALVNCTLLTGTGIYLVKITAAGNATITATSNSAASTNVLGASFVGTV